MHPGSEGLVRCQLNVVFDKVCSAGVGTEQIAEVVYKRFQLLPLFDCKEAGVATDSNMSSVDGEEQGVGT